MKTCKFCGKEIKKSEFDQFFESPENLPCSPECKAEKFNANRKAVEEYNRTTPEEWKHNPGIIFPQ